MRTIEEFTNLTKLFFQDIDLVATTEEEFLSFLIRQIPDRHRENLRSYLKEITRDHVSDKELKKLWTNSSAEIGFDNASQLRTMLRHLQSRI